MPEAPLPFDLPDPLPGIYYDPRPDTLDVIQFTDPMCAWSWGSEPVMNAVRARFGEEGRLRIGFIMGGLVADARRLSLGATAPLGPKPIPLDQANNTLARLWADSTEQHGMPINTAGFAPFSEGHTSSFPLCHAVKAAQIISEGGALRLLRRLREATLVEGQPTLRPETLAALATQVGLDPMRFREHMDSGLAEHLFDIDRRLALRYGALGFPTFLLRYNEYHALMHGYQSIEIMEQAIDVITAKELRPTALPITVQAVGDFVKTITTTETTCATEVAAAFNIHLEDAHSMLVALGKAKKNKE